MLHQPTLIRDRIIRQLRDLRVHISYLPIHEQSALEALEGPRWLENMTEIANFILEKLGGAPPEVKEPRFGKTHRALAKKTGPRGEPRAKKAAKPEIVARD